MSLCTCIPTFNAHTESVSHGIDLRVPKMHEKHYIEIADTCANNMESHHGTTVTSMNHRLTADIAGASH